MSYSSTILGLHTADILAYYRLGEASGSSAVDASVNALDGTYHSVVYGLPGPLYGDANTAVGFDATAAYVSLPTDFADLATNGFSALLWATFDSVHNFAHLFDLSAGATSNNVRLYRAGGTADINFTVRIGATNHTVVVPNLLNETDKWAFYAVTISAGGVLKIYKDGILRGTWDTFVTPGIGNRTNNQIGRSANADSYWGGVIDEVAFWGTELSHADVLSVWQAARNTSGSTWNSIVSGIGSLRTWFHLDESTSTVSDSSGNGYDGTETGAPVHNEGGALIKSSNTALQLNPLINDAFQTTDYITLASGGHYENFLTGFGFCCWSFVREVTAYARFFDLGNGAPVDNILLCRVGTSNDLRFEVFNNTTGTYIEATDVLRADVWQFIAATIDASGNGQIYVNGAKVAEGPVGVPRNMTRANVYVGLSPFGGDGKYVGVLDEVVFFGVHLTLANITALFAASSVGTLSRITQVFINLLVPAQVFVPNETYILQIDWTNTETFPDKWFQPYGTLTDNGCLTALAWERSAGMPEVSRDTMDVTALDASNWYDPCDASSPIAPNVVLGLPVRLLSSFQGQVDPQFFGFLSDITVDPKFPYQTTFQAESPLRFAMSTPIAVPSMASMVVYDPANPSQSILTVIFNLADAYAQSQNNPAQIPIGPHDVQPIVTFPANQRDFDTDLTTIAQFPIAGQNINTLGDALRHLAQMTGGMYWIEPQYRTTAAGVDWTFRWQKNDAKLEADNDLTWSAVPPSGMDCDGLVPTLKKVLA